MPNYQLGRTGQVFVAKETTYGTAPGFAATDAIRHLAVKLGRKKNRVDAPDRHTHPSQVYRRDRRESFEWSMGGILFPSGTLGTVPDMDPILECGLGAVRNVTLSTTVASGPTVTGA